MSAAHAGRHQSRRQSPPSETQPEFWIFAGPNGSGKSTFYRGADPEVGSRPFWIVNPDLLTLSIKKREGLALDAANLAAVQRLEAWLEATIDVHRSIGVETVLSTPKYQRLVTHAKTRGFLVRLIYVVLDSPERNIERVHARIERGGHAVPEHKIIERYWRSLEQLPWFLRQADEARIYDNSGAEPVLIAEKSESTVRQHPHVIPAVVRAIEAALKL